MSVTEEQLELIIKYIDQDLNEDEHKLFKDHKQHSDKFRQELEKTELLKAGIQAVEKAAEIDRIKSIFREFDQEKKVVPVQKLSHSKITLYGIAATIALIAAMTYVLIWQSESNDPASIYAAYYDPFPADSETRSDQANKKAMQYYEAARYEEAIPLLKEEMNNTDNLFSPVYLANAYLQTGEPEKAIEVLQPIVEKTSKEKSYSTQFYQWYLGLAYLKSNREPEAGNVFRILARMEGIYGDKSREILKRLD